MIPKIIHYCWFGRKPMPKKVIDCINSWKKYCPEYTIKEWNEDNFDIDDCDYVKQAYKLKKWAFVSDFVRISVIVSYGGIYLDTDVELICNFDDFLDKKAFVCFESDNYISTCVIGACKSFSLFESFKNLYLTKKFLLPNGTVDQTTNVVLLTNFLKNKGLILNGKCQVFENLSVYSVDYFCAKNYVDGRISRTKNTVAIHHFSGSWFTIEQRIMTRIQQLSYSYLGYILGPYIASFFILPFRIYAKIKKEIKSFVRYTKRYFL